MKKIFIGIDFSKETFDAALFHSATPETVSQGKFNNDQQGCKAFLKWAATQTKVTRKYWLICGEHTGLYSLTLATFLNARKIDVWLEAPLQIKQSQGITRGKTDPVDALRIARYACRFQDKIKLFQPGNQTISAIKDLMAYRSRIIGMKSALTVPANELHRVKQSDPTTGFIFSQSQAQIAMFDKTLKDIEDKINELIENDETVQCNYKIITSIKGVGMVNAVSLITATNNFEYFTDARKFSCYCGSAPFRRQSGSSLQSRDRVSHIADKRIKSLLTQAAESAVRHNTPYVQYYARKKEQGKPHYLIINNVRNKLIHLIFALVRSQTLYDSQFINPLQCSA